MGGGGNEEQKPKKVKTNEREEKEKKRDWSPGDPWPGLSHGEVVAVVMERGSGFHSNSWAGGQRLRECVCTQKCMLGGESCWVCV